MVAAAVQRAAVCAEMEEEKIVTDMVTGIMHRATLHEAQAFHADLLEAAQRTSLELQVKNDELALAVRVHHSCHCTFSQEESSEG